MFVEVGAAIEAAGMLATAIENRRSVLRVLRRLRSRIRRGNLRLPVFGDGGTGKTTLGHFLAGELDTGIALPSYRESLELSQFSLPGNIPCQIFVPPGQRRQRPRTWTSLYNMMSAGKAPGVINVVCYGLHSTELEQQRHSVYVAGMPQQDFVGAYTQHNRGEELLAIRELVPHLCSTTKQLWMITLVLKQDLWWAERQQVLTHYTQGEYEDCIQMVRSSKGEAHFTHHYLSASLLPANLVTRDGFTIATTTAGYDQPLRVANLNHFAIGLDELLKR